jgi:hypothetical protein
MFEFDKMASDLEGKATSFVKSGVSELSALNKKYNPFAAGGGGAGRTGGIWRYPLTIADQQHTSRLVFTATSSIEGDSPDAGRSKAFGNVKGLKFRDTGAVFLYMPKLQQAYTQNYSEEGRGLIWQLAKAFNSAGGIDKFGDASAAALKTGVTAGIQAIAPNLVRDFYQNVKNQYMSSHFTGTQLRKQKFDFELRPRNEEELFQIAGILQFFKANSATSLVNGGDLLTTPCRWIIEEVSTNYAGRHIAPFRFGPAYLVDVQIDKTPDGQWKTFENGDPIAINLTLEFMEITIVTRDDIEKLGL